MSARPDTWMPIYWGDYVRDTGHLNASGHGAYLMLIKHYWCTSSPLRNDDDELWRIACCDSKREWMSLKSKIIRLFQIDGELLRHKRIDIELSRGQEIISAKAKAGKIGAEKRWQQHGNEMAQTRNRHRQTDASAMAEPSVCHRQNDAPSPSPSPSPSSSLRSEEFTESSLRSLSPPNRAAESEIPTDRHVVPSLPLPSVAVRVQDSAEFQQFWQKYPRREGKGAARTAFEKARKSATFEAIVAGLSRPWPADPQFVPHPATWLNQQRWLDEPPDPHESGQNPPFRNGFAALGARLAEQAQAIPTPDHAPLLTTENRDETAT